MKSFLSCALLGSSGLIPQVRSADSGLGRMVVFRRSSRHARAWEGEETSAASPMPRSSPRPPFALLAMESTRTEQTSASPLARRRRLCSLLRRRRVGSSQETPAFQKHLSGCSARVASTSSY